MTCHNEHSNENSNLLYPEENIQPIKHHILGENNYNEKIINSLNSKGIIFSPTQTNEESENNLGSLPSLDEDNEEKAYSPNSNDNTFPHNLSFEEFGNNLRNISSLDEDNEEEAYNPNSNDNIFCPNLNIEEFRDNLGNISSFNEDNEEKSYIPNSYDNIFPSNLNKQEFLEYLVNISSHHVDNEEKAYNPNSNDKIFPPNPNKEESENNLKNTFENISDINSQNKALPSNNNQKNENKKFITSKKRGRKAIKLSKKSHDSSSDDNCLLKIQNNFFNFIIKLTNEVLNKEKIKEKFILVDYKIKRKVSHDFFCKLKKMSIKNILEMGNSPKYKSKAKDFNKTTLNKICNYSNDYLKVFFNMNYLELFSVYHNNEKPLRIFVYNGKEIELSKTKSFYYLLNNKNNKGKKIGKDLSNMAKRFFLDNSTFNKISFKTKKTIDLKE